MSDEKKYAGKFQTVEELEAGYKNAAKVFQENEDLKKKISPPTDYMKPEGLELPEGEFEDIRRIAKNAGLSQEHFDKVASELSMRHTNRRQKYEDELKSLGEENLNVLKDYVAKQYPEKVAETVLDKLILDRDARNSALAHREHLLSSKAPGLSKVSGGAGYSVTYNDVLKAREAANAKRNDIRLRDQYIKMTAEYAKQKHGA